jgi:hypothetical protein
MSEERTAGDIKTKAEELFEGIEAAVGDIVSPRTREALTDAIQKVVSAADDQATEDRERLANLEAQTRVLADAVIAIADTGASVAVAPAVQAVKAEIKGEATPSFTSPRGTYFDGRGTNNE